MPNWAECELTISGKSGVKICVESLAGKPSVEDKDARILDFNTVIPYPEDWAKQDEIHRKWFDTYQAIRTPAERVAWEKNNPRPEDGYNKGGYDWCCENWGTKWNACEVVFSEPTDKKAFYSFNTAWAPPIPVIKALSLKFPELTFTLKYWEQGAGYCGMIKLQNGETLDEEENNNYKGSRGG